MHNLHQLLQAHRGKLAKLSGILFLCLLLAAAATYPSTSRAITFFNFTLGNGGNVSVAQGTPTTITNTITATQTAGNAEGISFSYDMVGGLPTGMGLSFSPNGCTSNSTSCISTLSMSILSTTPEGIYPVTVTGTAGGPSTIATVPGTPTVVILTSGTSWTVPANWSSLNTVEVIGGGANGTGAASTIGIGGGGGGAYAKVYDLNLTPGAVVSYQIGNGTSGTDTYFNGTGTTCSGQSVCAKTGSPLTGLITTSALGGSAAASIGVIKYSGGAGGSTGGGAAGPNGPGAPGNPYSGGQGDYAFGGAGGASGLLNGFTGNAGTEWGTAGAGGGGGSGANVGGNGGAYGAGGAGAPLAGGAGAPGVIVITYVAGSYSSPQAMIFDAAGTNLYAVNPGRSTISKITPAGTVTTFATAGTNPVALIFDSSGNLYAANFGSNTVSKINSSGTVIATYTVGANPAALAVDSSNNVYVANYGGTTISKITSGGVVTTFATVNTNPTAIAIDSSSNLYVSTQNSNVISKITSGGVVSTFATLLGVPTTVILTSGTSWTVPSDWNSGNNTVEVIGGGGSGSFNGSGGGAYAKISNLALTPGNSVTYKVGGAAGDTYFNGSGTTCGGQSVCAKGGGTGGTGAAAGGSAASSIGTVTYSGGTATGGRGAGGAAGPHGAGGNSGFAGGQGDNGYGGMGGNPYSPISTAGGAGNEWGIAGSGGGGAPGLSQFNGGLGGLYGGGGSGGGGGNGNVGAPGVIVITYAGTAPNNPHALAFDSSGNLYTANYLGSTVSKINSSGTVVATYAVGANPAALAFDSAGNLYVANSGISTISKITSAGVVSSFAPLPVVTNMAILTSGTSWTVPYNWSSVNTIETIGAGGNNSSYGSTGGAYAKLLNLFLTPGSSVNYQVGSISGDTYFNGTGTTCSGQSVCAQSGNNGGGVATSIGTIKFSGGSGSPNGGGGAGGPNGAGASAGGGGGAGDTGLGGAGGPYTMGTGAPGSPGTEWVIAGSGGGAGAGSAVGSNGGNYGGGAFGSFGTTGGPGVIVVNYGGSINGPYSLAFDSSGYLYSAGFNPNVINKIFPMVTSQTSFALSVGVYNLTGPAAVLSGTAPTLNYKLMPNTLLFYLYSNVSGRGNWLYGPGSGAYAETGTIVGHAQTVAETYQIYPYDGLLYTNNPPTSGAGPTVPVAILTPPTATLACTTSCTITGGSSENLTYTLGGGAPAAGGLTYKVDGGSTVYTPVGNPFSVSSTLLPVGSHTVQMTVTNAAGTNVSNTVSLTVTSGPTITPNPPTNTPLGTETVSYTGGSTSGYVLECPPGSTGGGAADPKSCLYVPVGNIYHYVDYKLTTTLAPVTFTLPATNNITYIYRLYASSVDIADSAPVTVSNITTALTSFGAGVGITPTRVRKGGSANLSWAGTGLPNNCSITTVPALNGPDTGNGPGISNYVSGATSGSATAGPINAPTSFTLTCAGAPSKKVLITLIPIFFEI